jgi:hypothetical protein
MTRLEKAHTVLDLISYRPDSIQRMLDTVAEVYGPDDQLDEEHFENKKNVMIVLKDVCEETIDSLINQTAQVYSIHYSSDELDQLAVWYQSPLGQKVLSESNTIYKEILPLTEKWSEKIWNIVRLRMGWDNE